METWMLTVGAVVLATFVVGTSVWKLWRGPKEEKKKQRENHWNLFRTQLVWGEDAVLAEMVRDETVACAIERENFLRGVLKSALDQRYASSSVVDSQQADIRDLRDLVAAAEGDRIQAQTLQKQLQKQIETSKAKEAAETSSPEDSAANGTGK